MTPKEKAKELVDKFKYGLWEERVINITQEDAAHCALIAVDEIEKALTNYDMDLEFRFWEQVKTEIENL